MPSTARHGRVGIRTLLAVAALLGALAVASPAPASAKLLKGFWDAGEVGNAQFPIYKNLGVNVFQVQLQWNNVAPLPPLHPRDPKDPAYHWPSSIAYDISQAKKYHMQVLLMLIFSPRWANQGRDPSYAPGAKPFSDFAYAASKRYPSVHLWMVWGESNAAMQLQPQAQAPQQYAQLLDSAYGQLKKRDKHNIVIGGNTFTAGDTKPVPWVQHMRLPNGKPPRLDLYGHNPFTRRKPDLSNPQEGPGFADFSDLRRFNKTVDQSLGTKHHRHIQLFLSEWCEPTNAGDSEFSWWLTPEKQAAWIKAAFSVARKVGAYMLGWIHLKDFPPGPTGYYTNSGLIFSNGQHKPGYGAFKHG